MIITIYFNQQAVIKIPMKFIAYEYNINQVDLEAPAKLVKNECPPRFEKMILQLKLDPCSWSIGITSSWTSPGTEYLLFHCEYGVVSGNLNVSWTHTFPVFFLMLCSFSGCHILKHVLCLARVLLCLPNKHNRSIAPSRLHPWVVMPAYCLIKWEKITILKVCGFHVFWQNCIVFSMSYKYCCIHPGRIVNPQPRFLTKQQVCTWLLCG